ncbi:hypothetical protein [Ethanoligenens sp.]|uniref:hypothetical protein n=1 Tax=Ethanoligenens sp. TaxID=2099655 RepID=UPI0039E8701C
MAVSADYVNRLVQSLRRNTSDAVTAEVSALVDEARADMERLGILQSKAEDETDALIFGAVRDFCKWQFGLGNPDADRYMLMYQSRVNELRQSSGYYADSTAEVTG